jgi:hypothetical protein
MATATEVLGYAATGKLPGSYNWTGEIGDMERIIGKAEADKANLLQAPIIEGRYKQLQDQQIKSAQDFRKNLPGMAQGLMQTEQEKGRQALAQKMVGVDRDANRRGLLYGGNRMAGRTGAATNTMKELAQKRAEINSSLMNTADTMDRQAIETGFGMAGAGQNIASAQDAYSRESLAQQMSNRQKEFGAIAEGFKGIGSAIGEVLGGKEKPKNPKVEIKPVQQDPRK